MTDGDLLELQGVTKRFGGVTALEEVSFEAGESEIVGLIGPNGAGKTTLFKTIVGLLRPDHGRILFKGERIDGLSPHEVARRGISLAHQIPQPMRELTVLENVMIGAAFGREQSGLKRAREKAEEALTFIGLAKKREMLGRQLNVSEKSRLELARAIAGQPILLLLDEVAAGLNPTEVSGLLEALREVRRRGQSIVMVEHVMQAVMAVSDQIIVLHQGRKIAEGSPKEVARHEAVVEAYLGEPEEA